MKGTISHTNSCTDKTFELLDDEARQPPHQHAPLKARSTGTLRLQLSSGSGVGVDAEAASCSISKGDLKMRFSFGEPPRPNKGV